MENFILVIHYLVCIFLIIVILLQAGKGADMGATFGGGSSQTVFGSRGAATFLSKLTTGVAIVFLITSISLASISRQKSKSSVIEEKGTETQSMPVTPAPTASPLASPKATAVPSPVPSPKHK